MSSFIADYYRSFDECVHTIVAHGYDHAPAFRRRMEAANLTPADIQSVADLERLPVQRKEDLASLQREGPGLGGMLTVPFSSLRRIFQSPGPIHDPEPDVPDSWRIEPALRAAGFTSDDIVLNAFGYHLTPAGVMFEEGARALGCAVIPGGIGNQAQQIDAMIGLGVTAYVGLASYLKALLDKARESGHDPRTWPLSKAVMTAEPLPPSLRALLRDEYGVNVYQVYGTAECGNLAYEGHAQHGLHLPTDALVQVCDINSGVPLPPGQTGEIIVTLFRQDYILVRFAVGDLSALMDAPPAEDIPTPRLVGWLGRSSDSVKVRGIFVHPCHADEALRRIAGIATAQIIVTRHGHRDELTCRVVPAPGTDSTALTAAVEAALYDTLKLRCQVECVTDLPTDAQPFVDQRTWE